MKYLSFILFTLPSIFGMVMVILSYYGIYIPDYLIFPLGTGGTVLCARYLYISCKWCHSIYLNDRQFVTYKLFSLGILLDKLDYG